MANKLKGSFFVMNYYRFLAVFFILALALAGCGDGGGGDDGVTEPVAASIDITSSLPSGEQLPQSGSTTITAKVYGDSGKLVPDGTKILFEATTGRISFSATTVSGVATVPYYAPTAGGIVTITATLPWYSGFSEADATGALTLTVAASPDSVSLKTSLPPGEPLAQGGTTYITATVLGDDGTLIADGTEVLFSATSGTIPAAANTVLGKAEVPYTANAFGGTVTITATAGDATNAIDLNIASGPAAWIQTESITPARLGLRGTGIDERGTFVFNIQDGSGNPVADGTEVSFDLYSETGGGEFLSTPRSAFTLDGKVSVSLISGTVPGVATVTASTGTASTEARITMGYGKTDQDHISISFEPLNIAGMLFDGLTTEIGIRAADRFSNPVLEGTPIYLASSCGIVDLPAGRTLTGSNGSASATWYTSAPRSTLCTTIMWTEGEESYQDFNANGVFDEGDEHTDIGEPYIDANQNGEHDRGELYFDLDGDGSYTEGNGEWDGDTFVWTSAVTRWSDVTAKPVITPNNISTGNIDAIDYVITVTDVNGGPLPAGSKVTVKAGVVTISDLGTETKFETKDYTIRDAVFPGEGITEFIYTMPPNVGSGSSIEVTVEAPSGDTSAIIYAQ